jgi:hypothetical protein
MKDRACGKEAKSLSTKFLCGNLKERYLMQKLQNADMYLKQTEWEVFSWLGICSNNVLLLT